MKVDVQRAWSWTEQIEQIRSHFNFLLGFNINRPFFYKGSTDFFNLFVTAIFLISNIKHPPAAF